MARQKVEAEYTSDSIQTLEGLEHIKKRPSMYIGDTGHFGFHHLPREAIGNCIDEAIAGHCTYIEVILHGERTISIEDDGRGIPVGKLKEPKFGFTNSFEIAVAVPNTSGKFHNSDENSSYKVSGGLHGVGIKAANALSSSFEAWSYSTAKGDNKNKEWYLAFSEGVQTEKLCSLGDTKKRGTKVQFTPSEVHFGKMKFDVKEIRDICDQQAYLTPGLTIKFVDKVNKEDYTFYYENGVETFLKNKVGESALLVEDTLTISSEAKDGIEGFDATLMFTLKGNGEVKQYNETFANNIHTVNGGTHLSGFENGIYEAFYDFGIQRGWKEKVLNEMRVSDIMANTFFVINVKVKEPEFEGQTKGKLGNKDVRKPVKELTKDIVFHKLLQNPAEYEKVLERAKLFIESRTKAETGFDEILDQIAKEGKAGNFTGKLRACKNKRAENKELYIVEGDSAGGSVLKTRTDNIAMLPLKGVPINVEEKYDYKTENFSPSVLANNEIRSIISAFGGGIQHSFDEDRFPYKGGIIILNDEDSDGLHIKVLLLNALFRLYGLDFLNKYVYVGKLPLFQIFYKGERFFFKNVKEKDEFCEGKNISEKDILRFKGLGEYPDDLFKEIAIDRETRLIEKIHCNSYQEAEDMFYTLLGNDAALRRDFLVSRDTDYGHLDI